MHCVILDRTLISFQIIWIILYGAQKQRRMQIVYFHLFCIKHFCVHQNNHDPLIVFKEFRF